MKLNLKLKRDEGQRMLIKARPATHEGRENKQNKAYFYEVLVHEPFDNLLKKEKFAGFSALSIKDGKWMRFRMDRIECIVPLND